MKGIPLTERVFKMTADKNTDFDVYSVIWSAEIGDCFRRMQK